LKDETIARFTLAIASRWMLCLLKKVAEIQIASFPGILITINDPWMMAGIERHGHLQCQVSMESLSFQYPSELL
jgi:hypothetical protein